MPASTRYDSQPHRAALRREAAAHDGPAAHHRPRPVAAPRTTPTWRRSTGAPTPSIRASRSRPSTARIKLFEAKGFLERHDFGAGRGRYEEAARRHHDHLIDIETGQVIEFRNEEIERLQERVARELGFNLVGHKLELYGVPIKRGRK